MCLRALRCLWVRWRWRWETCCGWVEASSSRGHVPLSSLCFSEVFEHPVALPAQQGGHEQELAFGGGRRGEE